MYGAVLDVPLSSTSAAKRALLREPTAHIELGPHRPGPVSATQMIEALLLTGPGESLGPADVWHLSLADRDRIVAWLHTHCFGDQIETIVTCNSCARPFEMRFSLAEEVLEPLQRVHAIDSGYEADAQGVYTLTDGCRFRLPNTGDERALEGTSSEMAAKGLIRRCVVSGEVTDDNTALEIALEKLAPSIDVDVPIACPHCHANQDVRFDITSFFIASLARERPMLLREIHRLACVYHWSQDEIMGLPRSLRRAYVELIEVERGTLRAGI